MLHPAHSRVGRGNLVLIHSVARCITVEWRNLTPRFASIVALRNGQKKLNKYFVSLSGDRKHNQSRLQSQLLKVNSL